MSVREWSLRVGGFKILDRRITTHESEPERLIGLRTDIEIHIQAICKLVSGLLSQVEILKSESQPEDDSQYLNLREEMRRFEINLILRALTRTRGNQVEAARILGINATTLNAKLKRYGLERPYLFNSMAAQLKRTAAEPFESEMASSLQNDCPHASDAQT